MTVHIEVNGNLAIESSSTCWQLSRKNTNSKTGEVTWMSFKYFTSFESCLRELMEMSVRNSNAKTVSDLVRAYREASSDLNELCGAFREKTALEAS